MCSLTWFKSAEGFACFVCFWSPLDISHPLHLHSLVQRCSRQANLLAVFSGTKKKEESRGHSPGTLAWLRFELGAHRGQERKEHEARIQLEYSDLHSRVLVIIEKKITLFGFFLLSANNQLLLRCQTQRKWVKFF